MGQLLFVLVCLLLIWTFQAGKSINYTGASGEINFDENGDVLAPLDILCIQDGIVLEVTGRELVAALDHGLTHAGGDATGAFPSLAGM
jgi:hypothetical protein